MVLVDEHNSALPYSHAEWAHSNLGHYQVSMMMLMMVMVMVMVIVMVMVMVMVMVIVMVMVMVRMAPCEITMGMMMVHAPYDALYVESALLASYPHLSSTSCPQLLF